MSFKSLESLTSIAPSTIDITTYHIMTLGNWNGLGWSVWSSGWGDYVVQLVLEWLGWSWLSEFYFTQGKQVGHCSVSMFWVERWSGKLRWLGQLIWLFGWMVSVVKLVKWLGCWNQVVRMIYQILDKMEILC